LLTVFVLDSASFFTRRKVVVLVATLCCLLWGSAYPAIKSGYALFNIASRLVFAGLVLLVIAAIGKKTLRLDLRTMGQVSLLGLTQTSLQYVFFYTGLAHATGVKSSIMNATGTFFSVLLAHWIYQNDRLSFKKALGCIVGFGGVMVVNFSPGLLAYLVIFSSAAFSL
jgi:drug/metabolite transporter (DMT)-like permease